MVNAYWEVLQFEMPAVSAAVEPRRRCVDAFLDSPDDICDWAKGLIVQGETYLVQPRSVVLLAAQGGRVHGTKHESLGTRKEETVEF